MFFIKSNYRYYTESNTFFFILIWPPIISNRLTVDDRHVRLAHDDDVMVRDVVPTWQYCRDVCNLYNIYELGQIHQFGTRLLEYVESNVSLFYVFNYSRD